MKNRHENDSFITAERDAAVFHSALIRLLPKGIPVLLEEILYATVNAKHLQSMCPMAFIQWPKTESVL